MMESLQMYQCLLCQEEKNIWAIINYSPTWRKAFAFLENEHICRACANIEGTWVKPPILVLKQVLKQP